MWGMITLGDRVKVTKRGSKGKGKVVELPMGSKDAVVEMDNGTRVTVKIADTTGTRN